MTELQFHSQGGSLYPDDPTYVEREADNELLTALKDGDFCYVLNSRQMGKSSLAVRTIDRLLNENYDCVYLDLSSLESDIDPSQWYANIAFNLLDGLSLDDEEDLWTSLDLVSPLVRLTKIIETVILPEIERGLTIFIDEIDSVLGLKFNADDLFAFIRSCYNARSVNSDYKKLTFCLIGVASPAELIQDTKRTPFNIGRAIRLGGLEFDRAVDKLTPGLTSLADPAAGLREILDWTGGQPFLTQKVCRLVADHPTIAVSDLVRSAIVENWETNDEPIHLRHIAGKILQGDRAVRLLGLYRQVWGEAVAAPGAVRGIDVEGNADEMALLLSGVAVRDGGRVRVYNRIYREVFNLDWAAKEAEKIRPDFYGVKLARWVKSRAEGDLLTDQELAAAREWAQGKRLEDRDYDFLTASQEARMAWLQRLVEESQKQAEKALANVRLAEIRFNNEQKATLNRNKYRDQQKQLLPANLWELLIQIDDRIRDAVQKNNAPESSSAKYQAVMQALRTAKMINKTWIATTGVPPTQPIYAYAAYGLYTTLKGLERNTFWGHSNSVNSANFSPDGMRVVSASDDNTIKLWNATTGEELLTLNGHSNSVNSANFSPDGTRVISASDDKTIKLWDMTTGEELLTLSGHSEPVISANFSPDGTRMVSTSYDKTIKTWDATTGEELLTLNGHSYGVTSANFSPEGTRVVSASYDNTIKLWDATTGEKLLTFNGHSNWVYSANFGSGGTRVVSASSDKTIKVWDATTGEELLTLHGHSEPVTSANFSSDGTRVISASYDKTIKLWDAMTGEELLTLNSHSDSVTSANFSPDGTRVISASYDKTIKLWDVTIGEESLTLNGHSDWVYSANFNPQGALVVSASEDNTIKLWDATTGEELLTLNGHSDWVTSANFSPDGRRVVSTSDDNTIKLWDATTGEELLTLNGHSESVTSANFSPDGRQVVSASSDKTIKIWDATTGEELLTLNGHSSGVTSTNFSPDGRRVVSASSDKTIKIWDATTGEEILTLSGHSRGVTSTNFSPDAIRVVSASSDKTIKIWDATTGEEILTLNGHSDRVMSANFSPDGKMIVSASSDNTIKLWDAQTGEELQTLNGHSSLVNSANFSPDGQTIVSASYDNTIKLWKVESFEELLTRACDWLTPWLQNPNSEATDADRALCNLPPREATIEP
jgi:WD40 repeat protein